MSIYAAIDTGGTFTDLVMFDAATGSVRYTKSLTTRQQPIDGIMDCVGKVDLNLASATIFKHGTTLVINTLLERSGPSIALVTTRGFRDILELGRGNRTEPFNLFFRRDPPLVEREFRFEIDERIDGEGSVLVVPERCGGTQACGSFTNDWRRGGRYLLYQLLSQARQRAASSAMASRRASRLLRDQ